MKSSLLSFVCALLLALPIAGLAQTGYNAVDDTVCIFQGQPFTFNVTANDQTPPGTPAFVQLLTQSSCFALNEVGELSLLPNAGDCCGDHQLAYRYTGCQPSAPGGCFAAVYITVKCSKPDCFLVNLEDFVVSDSVAFGGTGASPCAYACENSDATYYVSYNPNNTYSWTVTGGTFVAGANPAQIVVSWGAQGAGAVSVAVTDPNNVTTVLQVCIDILQGPTAAFTPSATSICLNGSVTFTNTSTNATSYFWDFGDGATSTMPSPSHTYNAAGTYTACLIATRQNYDAMGMPLCCCSDTICQDIIVDDLPGPNIECISTLCAGDRACYWADVPGCSSYTWTVLDANGNPVPFTGQGADTICVQWGNGPFGTITLVVGGCPGAVCTQPVTVTVPIISPTTPINGPTIVCANMTATYSVQKWLSVGYSWSVTGGTIVTGQGTSTVSVLWGASGTGSISVAYGSSFLGGLPGHDPVDCEGAATLAVNIRPTFTVTTSGPNVVCLNTTSTFNATPPGNYTWTVSPGVPFTVLSPSSISVTWSTGPGAYTVTAMPVNPAAFCNASASRVIRVVETPPPSGIDGPAKICPGAMSTYYAQSTQTGVAFLWTVTGGSPAFFSGNPLTVTWNNTGPYSVSLQQVSTTAPNCPSNPVVLTPMPKLFQGTLAITGGPACVNTTANYSVGPPQDPDAVFIWTISPANAGSVVGGQGTPNVQVQWNNLTGSATLSVLATLCNDTENAALAVNVTGAPAPTITQSGVLCPGSTATLNAGPGYASYAWSGGLNPASQINTINAPGNYVVTVTSNQGCTSVGTFQATPAAGPTASISALGPTTLCIIPPNNNTVTIQALTGAGYTFVWSCNGGGVIPPATAVGPTLTHQNTNVAGSFAYQVTVTDANGCTNASNIVTVLQSTCPNTPPCPGQQQYNLSFTPMNQSPNCNTVNFAVTASPNVTLTTWSFGDPGGNTNSGTLANAVHTYSQAGCFPVVVSGTVPGAQGPCPVSASGTVCVPMAVRFDCSVLCNVVTFTNLSTSLPGQTISWLWDFGDLTSSTQQMPPPHIYTLPGTYTVKLTMSNTTGCQIAFSKTVVVPPPPTAAIGVSPVMPCVDEPVQFTGTGTGILTWNWNFADGASNGGQNPAHTYTTAGSYTVTLTVTNTQGCTGTVTQLVIVKPLPTADPITASGPLTICDGESVTLTASASGGTPPYMYAWSTLATTQSITVTTAGSYGVTITDANGCTAVPDSVTVIVNPLPPAYITGNPFICDAGCTLLSAPPGYNYVWLGPGNAPLAPPETGQVLQVCSGSLLGSYAVSVTDANGCSAVSAPLTVTVATSPSFTLTVNPLPPCAGTPVTITLAPVQPDVVYSWSTGATGPTITVLQAGTYSVIGVDTTTGCRDTANAVVHPLPDLCIVPAGCYEACDPDTICGPDGLSAYQWNLDGTPIAGATQQCLIVTQSGTYTLTGTNNYGCTATSDSLMLTLIDCECDALEVSVEPLEEDSCCFAASFSNGYGALYGLVIHSQNTDLDFDLGSLDPALQVFSLSANSISLVAAAPATTLPTGALNDFLNFCLTNVQNQPQYVIFDWYDSTFEVVCSDTLIFDCPAEPECLYLLADSIYCENGAVTYSLTVCNPRDNTFPVGYINVQAQSPAGVVLSPTPLLLSPRLLPGQCTTLVLTLTAPALEDSIFCFSLTAHDELPGPVIDTTHCCMLDTVYCVPIPDCFPCDDVGVDAILETPGPEPGECCVHLSLMNNFAANYFTGIALCAPPGSTLTINNPFGSGWTTVSYTPTMIVLQASAPLGTTLPLGSFNLPDFCIQTNQAPPQLLAVKWLVRDSVVCVDSVPLQCPPPCGYMTEKSVICQPDGTWQYSGILVNTSAVTMSEAHIVYTSPAGLPPETIAVGPLAPGGSVAFSVNIGPPAKAGDSVCFTVALHRIDDDEQHTDCCNFYDCIELPDCAADTCRCDNEFFQQVQLGFSCTIVPGAPLTYIFDPAGLFNPDCDTITWLLGNQAFGAEIAPLIYTFPAPGVYQVCMIVQRHDINGEVCALESCKTVNVALPELWPQVIIYPNPSNGPIYIESTPGWNGPVRIRLRDSYGRATRTWLYSAEAAESRIRLDTGSAPGGLYWLEIDTGTERRAYKVILH